MNRPWPFVQVAAIARPPRCSCDPAFFPDAVDVDCPVHGVPAFRAPLRPCPPREMGQR